MAVTAASRIDQGYSSLHVSPKALRRLHFVPRMSAIQSTSSQTAGMCTVVGPDLGASSAMRNAGLHFVRPEQIVVVSRR